MKNTAKTRKIEKEVIGEQGLAALALEKFEEAYEIEPMLPKTSLRKSLTTFRFSSILADLGPVASEIGLRDRCLPLHKPGPVHGRCLLLPAGCLSGGCRPG